MSAELECPTCGNRSFGDPDDDITLTLHLPTAAAKYITAIVHAHQAALADQAFTVVTLAEAGRDPDDNHYWDSLDDAWAITHDPTWNPSQPVRVEIAGDGSLTLNQLGHFIGAATAAWTHAHQEATTE